MPISRRELMRRTSALSLTAAFPLGCGDDAPSEGTGSSSEAGSSETTALPTTTAVTTTAVDGSSSSGGGDGLPEYEYEGDPGPETLFSHGVASGDPLTDAVILWTRLSPDEGEGAVEGFLEVALDPEFSMRVVAEPIDSNPERDHIIKIDVAGLEAGTTYYYRFFALGRESLTGRTRTAGDGDIARLRFGVCSCSSLAHGYFHAYRRVAERNDLDLVVHLGDYIYEYASGQYGEIRSYEPANEIVSLQDYRTRYGQYRRDADLQELHRQHPVVAVWDDHESANNAYKDGAENHSPRTEGDWEERKAVAYQAYAEWMPLREGMEGVIYRALPYGDLLQLLMLDTRLIGRDLAPDDVSDAELLDDPDRQLLGMEQEAWLMQQVADSSAQWQVLGQQVVMAEAILGENPFNPDQWDGYRAARGRVYEMAKAAGNVVVLTGDIHSSWAFDLAEAPDDDYDPETGAGSVGVEFVVPAVSSPGFPFNASVALMDANPHLHWMDPDQRGYMVLDVTPERVEASWWFVDDVESTEGGGESLGRVWACYDGTNHLVEENEPTPAPEGPAPAP